MATPAPRIAPSIMLAGAVLVGAVLRLQSFGQQLVISDEWHGLYVASQHGYGELLRLMTAGATSIPYNLYLALTLDSVGWSEWSIRLPSLVCGIATVAVLPWLLRESLGDRVAVLTAWLLALSPLLVFYSRYARPYSAVVLLTGVTLLAVRRFAQHRRTSDEVLLGTAGMLAAWCHVLELRALAIPLAVVLLARLQPWWPALRAAVRPPPSSWLKSGAGGLLGAIALLLPAALSSSQLFMPILARASPTLDTILSAFALLAGSANPVMLSILATLVGIGLFSMLKRDLLLAALVIAVTIGDVASVLIARPLGAHEPIVFARYVIPILPLGAICAALGVETVARLAAASTKKPSTKPGHAAAATGVFSAAATALVLAWVISGPLQGLVQQPNDFTLHKAFHFNYARFGDANERFLAYRAAKTPPFPTRPLRASKYYEALAGDADRSALIEYPVLVGDVYVGQFVYQSIHQRPVIGGYVVHDAKGPRLLNAQLPVGVVLSQLEASDRRGLRTLVDIGDPDALRASGAGHLIVHRNLLAELAGQRPPPSAPSRLHADLTKRLGPPAYEDETILVFTIPR